jgi:hypothetical protein
VKATAIIILTLLATGCSGYYEAQTAYYNLLEARVNKDPAAMLTLEGPDGFSLAVMDMRQEQPISPPANPVGVIFDRLTSLAMFGIATYGNYKINEANQETSIEMFRTLRDGNQSPGGPKFGDVNGNIVYGDGNQQADRIGSDYDYRWEFQDNSDNSNVWPSTVLRPEVVPTDVAVQIPTQVVTTERVVYP